MSKFALELFKQDEMKKIFRTLCVLFGVAFALTSCLGDDEQQVTTYSDMTITQFTLGTLNRYTKTVSSKTGNDTIIKSTLSGTSYPMTIDQLGRRIYNQTPLPVGTDVKHVICSTISTMNSGVVAVKSMTSDSLKWFSTTDSIDFSQPRHFLVYANDGTGPRDYTVTLNVSETEGTSFGWTRVATLNITTEEFDASTLVAFGDTVYVRPQGIVVRDDVAYRLNEGGLVEHSTDLVNWMAPASTEQPHLTRLIGAGTKELFALGEDGRLKASTDADGMEWYDETLDSDAALLPLDNIAMTSFPYAPIDNTDYVLMVGNSQQDAEATVVWRKISQYGGDNVEGKWVYMPVDDGNPYALPRQDGLSLACFKDDVLAVGSNMTVYQSADQGITWLADNDYAFPQTINGTKVRMVADKTGRVWVLTNTGELWLGRNI